MTMHPSQFPLRRRWSLILASMSLGLTDAASQNTPESYDSLPAPEIFEAPESHPDFLPAAFPEAHFPHLRTLLGAAVNRRLDKHSIRAEQTARLQAAQAEDRIRIQGGTWGAGIVEDRQGAGTDFRSRLTWELSGERTLYRFHNGTEARRALGVLEAQSAMIDARHDSDLWLAEVRRLYFDHLATTQASELQNRAHAVLAPLMDNLNALVAAGRIAELERAEIEFAWFQFNEQRAWSRYRLSLIREDLSAYTGLPHPPSHIEEESQRLKTTSIESVRPSPDVTRFGSTADLETLDHAVDAARARAQIFESDTLPRIVIRSRLYQDELQGPQFSGTVTRTNAELIIGIEWNIWDSGLTRSRARAESIRAERLESGRTRLLIQHQQRLRALHLALEERLMQERTSKQQSALAQRLLTAAEAAADRTGQNLPRLILAHLRAAEAEIAETEARARAWVALSHLAQKQFGEPFGKN